MSRSTALLLAGWGTDLRRLQPLAAHLNAEGHDARVWVYRPAGSIDRLATQLRDGVEHLHLDGPVHLVGHSFGGVLAAAAALQAPHAVRSVTTFNMPWRGTWLSYTGASRLANALRWGSPELAALRARLAAHAATPLGPSWLLLAALGDLATPLTTSLRAGARGPRIRRQVLAVHGHSLSLLEPRVHRAVAAHLARAGGTAPTTPAAQHPASAAAGSFAFAPAAGDARLIGAGPGR